jgi:hypothetical protein
MRTPGQGHRGIGYTRSMDLCANCGMADDHDDGECLLGSPSPGDDRRAWLKKKAPVEGTRARGDPSDRDDQPTPLRFP